ncbi:MAG TPA: P22 phage major capsid protein family protein [Rhizomicrobium sp.]|nr:P22 phage major capsid protein family protein [Rhizomicrobium sp.]
MSNTLLTPTQVTRKALMVLHQKLNFVGTINRGYDDSFAKDGAKIGNTLNIRVPNQYTVRTGPTLSTQDTTETSVQLQVSTQKGVDVNFTSNDLTMSLDDFSDRIIEPAMAVLAANIEADAMNMVNDVYQQINNQGSAITFNNVLTARKRLVDSLAPVNDRTCNLCTQDNVDLVDALKGLFQDSTNIAKQYREGYMGRTAGFDFLENTLWPTHLSGTENGSSPTFAVNGANQTGSSITVSNGSSKTLTQGDIITFAGCYSVHPETKAVSSQLQQFVVTAPVASTGTVIPISPAIVTSGAAQNVSASPTNTGVVTKVGTASQQYGLSLAYQKNAFAFATADLIMPRGVDFAAREVLDGVSMRIVRQYDIVNDKFPCRIDVLYGYKTIRPQLACRLANN